MIADLKAFLEADAQLALLLGAASGNTKIFYVEQEPGETTPFLLISFSTDGTSDDNIDEGILNARAVAETYEDALAIHDRIAEILDVQDDAVIPSSTNKFFYGKKIGGGSDTREPDTRLFHLARLLHVKYKRLTGG